MDKTLPVVILSGGLSTRLYPLTKNIPKALLEIAGKPFIFWQLEYLYNQGVRNVVLCVGHFGEMIKKEIGDGKKFGLQISYSFDGSEPLGTGGALKNSLELIDDNFFVLYGDVYLPIDYIKVQEDFLKSKLPACMTIYKNDNSWDKSNIIYENEKIIEYNKFNNKTNMRYIDYGLSIFNKKAFKSCADRKKFDLAELLNFLSINGLVLGHEVFDRFYEVGSHSGIVDTENFFKNK
tara:strand:- start:438 stop:1142 length:705 start_codon:yes stop_codon:yes gene_type:complete